MRYRKHASGLLLPEDQPRLLRPLCMAAPQQALLMAGAVGALTRIDMTFEGANNSTTITDAGSAGSAWTVFGGAKLSTSSPLSGTSSLLIPSCTADGISTPYNANNKIPATQDFTINITVQSAGGWATGGVGKTFLSCQDSTPTAAGTVFAVATNSSSQLSVVYSDGVTRSATGGFQTLSTATAVLQIKRSIASATLGISVNGGAFNNISFSSSFAFNGVPSGSPVWRIGNTLFGNSGSEQWKVDNFQLIW